MAEEAKKHNQEAKKGKANSEAFGGKKKIVKTPIPIKNPEKKKSRINTVRYDVEIPLQKYEDEPLWVSVSEAAKLGGVQGKTIRRAIQDDRVKYQVVNDRYSIDFGSVVQYLYTSTKLKNKIVNKGIAKYIKEWKE